MDLKQIEHILKVAEEKNVSRATMKLFISRSALNQQLLKLGKESGAPLSHRTRHNWEFIETGELYAQGVCKIMFTKEDTYHRIADVPDQSQRSSFPGMPGRQGIAMFTSIYPRFLQVHPNVSTSPLEIGSYNVQNVIINGDLNLDSITIGPREETNINYIHIHSEEFYATLSSSHPITRPIKNREKEYPQLDLWSLRDGSFVLMYQKFSCRAVADPIFQETGSSSNILFKTSSATSIPFFVSPGICRATTPKCYVKNVDGISLPSLPSHPYWDLDFCYARQGYISQPLKTFIELSKDCWRSCYQDQ